MSRTAIIQAALLSFPHPHPRVQAWLRLGMELQYQANTRDFEPVCDETGQTTDLFSNNIDCIHHIRVPTNANTDPINNDDVAIGFPVDQHAKSIGMTGWDWKHRQSVRIGFDFDSAEGHVGGVASDVLDSIIAKLSEVPESLVLRSPSGSGLHVYFEFPPGNLPATANHDEHALLAAYVLQTISARIGFDLAKHLDVGGGNMWIWKSTMAANGLTTIKDNSAHLIVPDDWREHVTKKPTPAKQSAPVEMDADHKRVIDKLQANTRYTTVWVPELNLLQTHTRALKQLHDEGSVLGFFDTNSEGTDSKPNCFLYLIENGAFRATRYGKGTTEHESWERGEWTWTFFNKQPTLKELSERYNGRKVPGKPMYQYTCNDAQRALLAVGCAVGLPFEARTYTFLATADGLLVVTVNRQKADECDWAEMGRRWGYETDFVIVPHNRVQLDNNVFALALPSGDIFGYAFKQDTTGRYTFTKSESLIQAVLSAHGVDSVDIKGMVGQLVLRARYIVAQPFQLLFPSERECNWHAPQLAFPVSATPGQHPTWDLILEHLGCGLNDAVAADPWCKSVGILTGADYLFQWIVRLFRCWDEPLPYLYLYGPQNAGKSALHEALRLLFVSGFGVANAKVAVRNKSDFNGELVGAILYYIEELNLGKNANARAIIKEWITGDWLMFHGKNKTPYEQKNTLHGIQCSNDLDASPIERGDERLVAIHCRKVTSIIQRKTLHAQLAAEAPYFLHSVFNTTPLNKPDERLGLPPLMTDLKKQMLTLLEKESTETRATDYDALANIVPQIIGSQTFTTTELLDVLPNGPWPSHCTQLGPVLTDERFKTALKMRGHDIKQMSKAHGTPKYQLQKA